MRKYEIGWKDANNWFLASQVLVEPVLYVISHVCYVFHLFLALYVLQYCLYRL